MRVRLRVRRFRSVIRNRGREARCEIGRLEIGLSTSRFVTKQRANAWQPQPLGRAAMAEHLVEQPLTGRLAARIHKTTCQIKGILAVSRVGEWRANWTL